jgi:F420-dependent oxidoreductase-like protein
MRFSIWLGMEQPWEELLAAAGHAERTGWDAVYVADHFTPGAEPTSTPRLEAWTTIAALATRVARVRVGVLVTANNYRHPAVLANMAATVDHLSAGRHVLGLGAGWQPNGQGADGSELPAIPERLARLEEALEVIGLLHSEERSSFEGRFYRLTDAPCEPKPIQRPLPLLVGGSGESISMRIVARYADEWNCWGLPDLTARRTEDLERHCAEIGRDPASIKRSAQALVMMSDDGEQVTRWRSDRLTVPHIVGTPAEVAEVMGRYAEIGVDEFIVPDRTLGRDASERRDKMDQFLGEATVHLRHLPGR